MGKRFALIGVGGFIAPRHLRAIKDNNGELVCSCDVVDSVGVIDSYFPDSYFFNTFNAFERFIVDCQSSKKKIDYLCICSPNYLHHSHIRFGLVNNMDVICEKPLLINTKLLTNLFKLKKSVNKEIYCILQLRTNPDIIKLKESIQNYDSYLECELNYNTPRGRWYDYSWKGNFEKSGGILYNIGIHLFDILIWIFGDYEKFEIVRNEPRQSSGILYFKNVKVKWNLSINALKKNNFKSTRTLKIKNDTHKLDGNFSDSHSLCYKEIILKNKLFNAQSSVDSLILVSEMIK